MVDNDCNTILLRVTAVSHENRTDRRPCETDCRHVGVPGPRGHSGNAADGMSRLLTARKIRIFDYRRFANPLKDGTHENAKRIAAEAGVQIKFIRMLESFRKADRIREILGQRGDQPVTNPPAESPAGRRRKSKARRQLRPHKPMPS